MGRGSHLLAETLLAENVGGCTSGQRFATPCRRDTGEGQLTFYVAWTVLWLGFVVSPAAPCVFLLLGFDLLPVFLFSSAWSSSAHYTGSGNSTARVRTCSVGGKVSHQQRQLSNSHSRMVRGLPVRRSISRHGFTEFVPRETAVPSVSSGPSSLRTFSPSCWQLSSCRRLSSRLQSRRSALRSG
jgi:hypothetical protein